MPLHDVVATKIGRWKMGLGRAHEAVTVFGTQTNATEREFELANQSVNIEDLPGLRRHMQSLDHAPFSGETVFSRRLSELYLLSLLGNGRSVEAELSEMAGDPRHALVDDQSSIQVTQGCVSLQRGDPSRAAALLAPLWHSILRDMCLADAYDRLDQLDKAVGAMQYWDFAQVPTPAPMPIRNRYQLRLAELYHKVGRDESARKIADYLTHVLSEAEPDFPLLSRLRQLQAELSGRTGS
jgi:hypothetical protein